MRLRIPVTAAMRKALAPALCAARDRRPAVNRGASGSSFHFADVPLYPRLRVSNPADASEHEANRMAAKVLMKCSGCRDEEEQAKRNVSKGPQDERLFAGGPAGPESSQKQEEEVQRETAPAALAKGAAAARSIVRDTLHSEGAPLDAATRAFLEPRFGFDFGHVRIHHDLAASASADAVHADAYTVGDDIVFRSGQHQPDSSHGRGILAHELAHVVQHARSSGDPTLDRLTTSVASGAAASNALGPCDWGLTFPESVDVTMAAVKSAATWKADPTDLKGHYSQQTRLLPSEKEVTGPAGNTTSANHCAQVGELKRLGACPGAWYMLAAVVAHENVHATRFDPALKAAGPNIVTDFNALTVADAPGKTAAAAETELKALPGFAAAVTKAQSRWLTEVLKLVAGDHKAGGPTDTAEHGVVDPMAATICTHAKTSKWPACADCP